ncbi:MAG: FAD-binding protein [Gemmatimonas sp.]|nr:FAD-binding protein [Gemmatimonas sp.]
MAEPTPYDYGFNGDFETALPVRAAYAGASGILAALPCAVAAPRSTAAVAALLEWSSATATPIVPRGAATGMPGGNVGPGVVVDLVRHFRAPPVVDPTSSSALVECGVTPAELNRAAARHRLHFPVDPSSWERCTFGGMIANNAAGAHSVRYGATRRWVREIDLVLADGTTAHLRRGAPPPESLRPILARFHRTLDVRANVLRENWPRLRKNSSGYALLDYLTSGDPIDLIVGSEGTLAIVTSASLDLAPFPPATGLVLLEFDDLRATTDAVLTLLPLQPLTCEILDRTFLDVVRSADATSLPRLDPALEAVLLVEFDAPSPDQLPEALDQIRTAVDPFAVRAYSALRPDAVADLWRLRHAASPLISRHAGNRVSMQFIEDSVVPVSNLPDYLRGLRQILHRFDLPAVVFGHAGDGNIHVNPLVDVQSANWRDTLDAVLLEVTELVVSLGGTLSGEHGDGRLRAPALSRVWHPDIVACFQALKSAFDPVNLLNPGVILPSPGQRPFDMLRKFA